MISDVYWVSAAELGAGRLAVAARPRGGDWLDGEVDAWRLAGITHVLSLLTASEARELDLGDEAHACGRAGIEFISLPVPDRGVPLSRSTFRETAVACREKLGCGATVLVHCRQGIGRASMMAAAILAEAGASAADAFVRIERARGRPVPDTEEQRVWITTGFDGTNTRAQHVTAADAAPPRR